MEDHVEDPMEPVFDAPVGPRSTGQELCVGRQGGDVEVPGCLAFLTSLDLSLDQADAVQAGPIVTRVKPVDVGNGPGNETASR